MSRALRKPQISFLKKANLILYIQINQKYFLFLLKFDHFRYAAIFQCQKVGIIKMWLNSIISNHECASNPIAKCVDVTHWLKKHVCILRQFSIFPGGLKSCPFVVEAESMDVNLPPCRVISRVIWIPFSANQMFRLMENHFVLFLMLQ